MSNKQSNQLPANQLPAAFRDAATSSFTEFLDGYAPQLLPQNRSTVIPGGKKLDEQVPHGTTIVALTFPGGVVMGGDRRATMGNIIASREIEKVFPADEYSCVGIAGSAGLAIEMVKLFQVELEHYEKIEGELLSLDGKANRLATMIRNNMPMALQGLAVVPLFVGYDLFVDRGRIFSYDITGGRYEEPLHHSVGSGSLFARGSLKKLYKPTYSKAEAIRVAIEALFDAADDDSATGGPDLHRMIFPVIATVTAEGFERVPDGEIKEIVQQMLAERQINWDAENQTRLSDQVKVTQARSED